MKFDSSDILAILRKFAVANDGHMPRQIESISKHKPHDKNVVIRFNFNGNKYTILIDNAAEDDESYIYEQAQNHEAPKNYQLIANPLDEDLLAYGMPYKGKDCYLLVDTPQEKRLDVALVERFSVESRSTYQKMILSGQVTVNGLPATSPKQLVLPSDKITVAEAKRDFVPIKCDVLYEDDDILVIDKPAGLLTHAKGVIADEFTAADIIKLKTNYKQDTNRPGIVHRLDRETSGVLLMVKNTEAASMIQKQFSNRTVKKTYISIVTGQPNPTKALIDLPIERNPSAPSTFRVGANGKPAQTLYTLIKSSKDGSLALVKLQPKTGRTHQLRVHMQYIKTPILGDVIYGDQPAERMFLHAESLELTIPSGERKVFTAPLPPEFTNYFN